LIEHFLPTYQFSERHVCAVAAPSARVLDAVAAYRPESDPLFRAMIGLRELPMRLFGRPDHQRAAFGIDDFTLLGRDETSIVYGLVGQFWKPNYGLAPVADGAAFLAFDADDVAKLVLAFAVNRDSERRTRLVTETRIHCASRATRLKLTPYWLLIRPVSGLLRRRILSSVRKACEQGELLS
jgi:hypothetical protein